MLLKQEPQFNENPYLFGIFNWVVFTLCWRTLDSWKKSRLSKEMWGRANFSLRLARIVSSNALFRCDSEMTMPAIFREWAWLAIPIYLSEQFLCVGTIPAEVNGLATAESMNKPRCARFGSYCQTAVLLLLWGLSPCAAALVWAVQFLAAPAACGFLTLASWDNCRLGAEFAGIQPRCFQNHRELA